MKHKLDERIEEIASKYNFTPRGNLNTNHVEANKAFLAMLDYYVSKTHSQLPDPVRAIDIGCADMRYADGLITFLERYGKKQGESRNVKLVGIDGIHNLPDNSRFKTVEDAFVNTDLYLIPQFLEDNKDMEEIRKKTGIKMFDFVTMFAPYMPEFCSPHASYDLTTLMKEGLKPNMTENGLLVIAISPGGTIKRPFLESLDTAGFDVLVNKPNKFVDNFLGLHFTYSDMVIARNTG